MNNNYTVLIAIVEFTCPVISAKKKKEERKMFQDQQNEKDARGICEHSLLLLIAEYQKRAAGLCNCSCSNLLTPAAGLLALLVHGFELVI